jgi:hypothetical protein
MDTEAHKYENYHLYVANNTNRLKRTTCFSDSPCYRALYSIKCNIRLNPRIAIKGQ